MFLIIAHLPLLVVAPGLMWLGPISLAAAVAWMVATIANLGRQAEHSLPADPFESERRKQLRAGSAVYRWFEPLVDEHVQGRDLQTSRAQALSRYLTQADEPLPWQPYEFLATKMVEGVLVAISVFLLVSIGSVPVAFLLAIVVALAYPSLMVSSLKSRAERRMKRIRLRMPYVVDLIALLMEAGAGFAESLETVIRQLNSHPLGKELSEVTRQIQLGRPRSEALRAMQDRLQDDDVTEFVFAVNKGEELGTPLSTILRNQADQMRLKRSQWGEKAAKEAEVQMVFPGMVVMVACLLVVVTPIILPAILWLFE